VFKCTNHSALSLPFTGFKFSDGGRYIGDWVNGRFEGYGECYWRDGRIYKVSAAAL